MTEAKVLLALQPGDPDYTPENPYKWADAEGIMNDPGMVATLNATFVRFEDLAGNPITARSVLIKVDTSTWEIADIVAEA